MISGKKIKLKIDKTERDLAEERKRQALLMALNEVYE